MTLGDGDVCACGYEGVTGAASIYILATMQWCILESDDSDDHDMMILIYGQGGGEGGL